MRSRIWRATRVQLSRAEVNPTPQDADGLDDGSLGLGDTPCYNNREDG
jgi:hypothetical protein